MSLGAPHHIIIIIIIHHFRVTVPLRKCTCSHFLLFVWGGLALGRYWAKLEHQSAQKTRGGKKKDQQTLDGCRRPRHRPPAFPHLRTDMRFTGMLAGEARDGAAATHTNWDGDVRSVGDGGWRLGGVGCIFALCIVSCYFLLYSPCTNAMTDERIAEKFAFRFSRIIRTHEWDPR